MFAPLAHPGRVDEEKFLAAPLMKNIDGSPGSAGQLTHDRARIAQNRIDQRRFSGIRAAHDGEGSDRIDFGFWTLDFGLGKKTIDSFQEIGNSTTVRGAYRNRIVETEPR